jgi:UDP-3-O-[3-hydroxymyristoyl] glucosamine N-acyltransferase
MKFKAEEIALFLGGEIVGDPTVTVSNVSKIEEGKPGTLAFLANPKYESFLYTSGASVVLVNSDFIPRQPVQATLIKVQDAYQAFAALLEMYTRAKDSLKSGIEQPSYLHETAVLGSGCWVGAFAYAGRNVRIGSQVKIYPHVYIGDNVTVGDGTILYSGAKIYEDTVIGQNCIIHSGAVIGSDGFGFAPQEDGSYRKIPQIGNVILEDNVEIGANTTIDCGTMGSTIIRKGVKLDNLIMIAHNCEVGENTVMAAHTGLAGSTKVGRNCKFAGQVGLAGHLTIGDNVQIGAQSGVPSNVKSDQIILGSPAMDYRKTVRVYSIMKNLPQLRQEVIDLQKDVKVLKENRVKKTE